MHGGRKLQHAESATQNRVRVAAVTWRKSWSLSYGRVLIRCWGLGWPSLPGLSATREVPHGHHYVHIHHGRRRGAGVQQPMELLIAANPDPDSQLPGRTVSAA